MLGGARPQVSFKTLIKLAGAHPVEGLLAGAMGLVVGLEVGGILRGRADPDTTSRGALGGARPQVSFKTLIKLAGAHPAEGLLAGAMGLVVGL